MIRASTPTTVRFHMADEDDHHHDQGTASDDFPHAISTTHKGELELKPLDSFRISAAVAASPASVQGEKSGSVHQSASTRFDSASAPPLAQSQEMKSQEVAITYQMASQTISIRMSDAELKKNMRALDETEMSQLVGGNHGLEKELNHVRPIEELKTELKAQYQTGASRRAGNVLSPPKSEHWFIRLAELCLGGFNWLLLIIATLDVLSWKPLGEDPGPPQPINWYTGVTLFICIFINTLFTAYQLRKSSNILQGFRNLIPTQATVWDETDWKVIPAEQLQKGDTVLLRAGSKIPADVRLLTCNGLKVDNSMLTGESEPISCSVRCTSANYLETRNMAFFGSMAVEGEATGLIVDVGDDTVMGRITQLTGSTKKKQTSLEIEINRFVRIIVTLIILTLIPSVLTWRFWLYDAYPGYLTVPAMVANVGAFVVGYTPEGLSVALTMTLTIVAARMAKQNVLVKDLAIIEAFNTISLIASDKTGTLTQNSMSVRRVKWGLTSHSEMEVDTLKERSGNSTNGNPLDTVVLRDLARCAILCNGASRIAPAPSVIDVKDSSIVEPANQDESMVDQCLQTLKKWGRSLVGHVDLPSQKVEEFDGNASDRALFQWMEPNLDVNEYRKRNPAVATQPFNSRNKYMISIHRLEKANAGMLLFLKGAPEVVLGRCSRVLDADGVTIRKMTDSERAEWSSYQEAKGAQGERVLGFAGTFLDLATYPLNYRFNVDEGGDKPNYPTTDLIFFGMVSLVDPPRPEVPAALARCRAAHIRVAMVTGDHPSTATAIAEQIGLLSYKERDTFTVTTDAANRVLFVANANGVAVGTHNVVSKSGSDGPLFTSVVDTIAVTDPSFTVADHQVRLQRGITVTGTQLSLMDEPLWNWVLRHDEIVFARVTPEQKLRIVTEAQARLESVAVTGDGVNDAPALRQANLGIAMFNGSEVAREAGHIILVDNNFNSIVNGIELGRTVYDNMKKCIAYLLPAGTWSEMLTILCNVFLGIQPMLSAFLMIIICLCTDVFVSIALVNETAESQVMTRHPRKKDERLVDAKLILTMYMTTGWMMFFASTINYFWYASDQGLDFNCTFWAFQWGDQWCGKSSDELFEIVCTGQCIFFVTLVIMQWGNAFAVRTRRVSVFQHNPFYGPHKNLYLPVGIFFAFLMLLFITLTPFFQNNFGTRQVPIKYALVACVWAVWLVIWDELRKLIIRRFPNSFVAKVAW